jgi:hypothetical protein
MLCYGTMYFYFNAAEHFMSPPIQKNVDASLKDNNVLLAWPAWVPNDWSQRYQLTVMETHTLYHRLTTTNQPILFKGLQELYASDSHTVIYPTSCMETWERVVSASSEKDTIARWCDKMTPTFARVRQMIAGHRPRYGLTAYRKEQQRNVDELLHTLEQIAQGAPPYFEFKALPTLSQTPPMLKGQTLATLRDGFFESRVKISVCQIDSMTLTDEHGRMEVNYYLSSGTRVTLPFSAKADSHGLLKKIAGNVHLYDSEQAATAAAKKQLSALLEAL